VTSLGVVRGRSVESDLGLIRGNGCLIWNVSELSHCADIAVQSEAVERRWRRANGAKVRRLATLAGPPAIDRVEADGPSYLAPIPMDGHAI